MALMKSTPTVTGPEQTITDGIGSDPRRSRPTPARR